MRQLSGNNNKKNNCNINNNATATTSITMAALAIIMDDAADPAPTSSTKKAASAWPRCTSKATGTATATWSRSPSVITPARDGSRWCSASQCFRSCSSLPLRVRFACCPRNHTQSRHVTSLSKNGGHFAFCPVTVAAIIINMASRAMGNGGASDRTRTT